MERYRGGLEHIVVGRRRLKNGKKAKREEEVRMEPSQKFKKVKRS